MNEGRRALLERKMNCKPGDLAVIKRGFGRSDLVGLPVTVVREAYPGEEAQAKHDFGSINKNGYGVVWYCDGPGAHLPRVIADRCLRPIRPQPDDAVDETLTWLPVPSTKETV